MRSPLSPFLLALMLAGCSEPWCAEKDIPPTERLMLACMERSYSPRHCRQEAEMVTCKRWSTTAPSPTPTERQ